MDKNAIKNDKFKYYRVIAKIGGENMAELPIAQWEGSSKMLVHKG